MGAYQSKPTAAERAIIDRLRSLDMEKKQAANDDGYVEVDDFGPSGSPNEKTLGALRRSPTTLDVSQLEDWQAKLLEDPKNRYQTEKLQLMLGKASRFNTIRVPQARSVGSLGRQPSRCLEVSRRPNFRPTSLQYQDPV